MPLPAIEFHPLTFVDERDGVVVGRPDTESYAVLPHDGAALLRRLADGHPADEAARWYLGEFGESVDIGDFVSTLRELGFVREGSQPTAAPPRLRMLRLGAWTFSPTAWVVHTALVTTCIAVMVTHPRVRPHSDVVFFTPSLVAVQLTLAFAQVPAVAWHEFFHVLAGRRLVLPTRLSVSRRLFFVVVEAHLDGLYSVPRKKRYLPFLAGMLADVLLFSTLTLVGAAGTGWAFRLALAIAYTVLLRLVWQFYLFLRTDLYYVFTTLLGCSDLHGATSAYLWRKASRLPGIRRPTTDSDSDSDADSAWSERDRQVAPWFALLTVGGVGLLLATAILALAPLLTGFVTRLGPALANGADDSARFWDSATSVALFALEFTLLILVSRREASRSRTDSR
ncbi:hypothetical protein [Streptomyces melanogenes]|uniref:hypothetical protein n=1 Tax=Streptomyces melanogenes TaxID=67326 RepID=UPI00167D1D7E|nr:hypothetical protein [Streptomyces melanogenes]GGP82443.1 hypothetical protein GCM10010278_71350 [Streptomyces melanogenes]